MNIQEIVPGRPIEAYFWGSLKRVKQRTECSLMKHPDERKKNNSRNVTLSSQALTVIQ